MYGLRPSIHMSDDAVRSLPLRCRSVRQTPASQTILDGVCSCWPWLKREFVYGAYGDAGLINKAAMLDFAVQVVHRCELQSDFVMIPK